MSEFPKLTWTDHGEEHTLPAALLAKVGEYARQREATGSAPSAKEDPRSVWQVIYEAVHGPFAHDDSVFIANEVEKALTAHHGPEQEGLAHEDAPAHRDRGRGEARADAGVLRDHAQARPELRGDDVDPFGTDGQRGEVPDPHGASRDDREEGRRGVAAVSDAPPDICECSFEGVQYCPLHGTAFQKVEADTDVSPDAYANVWEDFRGYLQNHFGYFGVDADNLIEACKRFGFRAGLPKAAPSAERELKSDLTWAMDELEARTDNPSILHRITETWKKHRLGSADSNGADT